VQCPHCDLFGHVNKIDCKYKHCINVDVDWLDWQKKHKLDCDELDAL
jgi:hypothetical protein